ncbi:MAG: IS1634 family transposase [bacterium]
MSFRVEKKEGNNIYVYETRSIWNKEKKQSRQKRVYLGIKDPETGEITTPRKNRIPVFSKDYGNVYFLEKISEKYGLVKVLSKSFPDSYNEILALSYLDICEENPHYIFPYWYDLSHLKNTRTMSAKQITEFMEDLGTAEEKREGFISSWVKKINKKDSGLFFDITSISTYSNEFELAEYGYNRDLESLPQINIGVLYGQESQLPLSYRIYQGSISDVTTLKKEIAHVKELGIKSSMLILDRGFYSQKNIKDLVKNKLEFIIGMTMTTNLSKELIIKNCEEINDAKNAFLVENAVMYGLKEEVEINGDKFEAFVYLDDKRKGEEKENLIRKIIEVEEKMNQSKIKTEEDFDDLFTKRWSGLKELFNIKRNGEKFDIERNNIKIKEKTKRFGMMLIITNKKGLDFKELLLLYRQRDYIEKYFDILKNETDGNRLRSHKKEMIEGRLFVKFITSIIFSAIYAEMRKNTLLNKYTVKELIYELKKLRIVTMSDEKHFITEISKHQREIFNAFELQMPD